MYLEMIDYTMCSLESKSLQSFVFFVSHSLLWGLGLLHTPQPLYKRWVTPPSAQSHHILVLMLQVAQVKRNGSIHNWELMGRIALCPHIISHASTYQLICLQIFGLRTDWLYKKTHLQYCAKVFRQMLKNAGKYHT